MFCTILNIFFYIGCARVILSLISILKSLYIHKLQTSLNLPERYGKGSYAVIADATSEIGQAFAKKFADLGFNLVLLYKDEQKLALENINVETKTIHADFETFTETEDYEKIVEQLKDIDVSIIVNNVETKNLEKFEATTTEELSACLKANNASCAIMTVMMLKQLMSRELKRSAIINLSSAQGIVPISNISMFSGTKGFVRFFSRGITEEYKKKIDILTCCPGLLKSEFTDKIFMKQCASPDESVATFLKSLGQQEEVSSSIVDDFVFYGVLQQIYFCSFKLYNEFIDKYCVKFVEKLQSASKLKKE